MKKRLAGLLFSVTAVAGAVGAGVSPASADTTVSLTYPVSGSTYINAIRTSIPLGPGTLSATADLTTSAVTGNVNLPAATGSFKELGLVPVTATTAFVEQGQTTGTLESDGGIQATSHITLKLTSLKVAGIPVPVGNSCQTAVPATITLTSESGFNALTGGTVSGTYTIPRFVHCLLATPLINLTLPGPNNTITLNLGAATGS
ncbi:MAG TPA: hypothetical protein VGJ19_12205 [Streptosporangiaceae bacterium]